MLLQGPPPGPEIVKWLIRDVLRAVHPTIACGASHHERGLDDRLEGLLRRTASSRPCRLDRDLFGVGAPADLDFVAWRRRGHRRLDRRVFPSSGSRAVVVDDEHPAARSLMTQRPAGPRWQELRRVYAEGREVDLAECECTRRKGALQVGGRRDSSRPKATVPCSPVRRRTRARDRAREVGTVGACGPSFSRGGIEDGLVRVTEGSRPVSPCPPLPLPQLTRLAVSTRYRGA